MDSYFMELLIKERQQQILDDFERIQISRAINSHKVGIFKRFILGLSEILIAMGTCLQKRYRPSVKSERRSYEFFWNGNSNFFSLDLAERPAKK